MRNKMFLVMSLMGVFCWLTPNLYSAEAIKVAILDSGSNIDYKEGVNFVDGSLKDVNGHGTLIAKIIKDECPNAEFYIVKVIAKSGVVINEDAVVLGIEWAISRGVKVINMSLRMKPSARLNAVIKKAHANGIILVAAAGNNDKFSDSYYSAQSFTGGNSGFASSVAYPAKYPEVIAVGALDKYGRVYDASVQSERVDLYFKGYKGRKAGTSIASAYVTGTIAHIISSRSGADKQEQEILALLSAVWLRCSQRLYPLHPAA